MWVFLQFYISRIIRLQIKFIRTALIIATNIFSTYKFFKYVSLLTHFLVSNHRASANMCGIVYLNDRDCVTSFDRFKNRIIKLTVWLFYIFVFAFKCNNITRIREWLYAKHFNHNYAQTIFVSITITSWQQFRFHDKLTKYIHARYCILLSPLKNYPNRYLLEEILIK